MRGRKKKREVQAESDEEFDEFEFGMAKEAEDGYGGSHRKRELDPKITEHRDGRVVEG